MSTVEDLTETEAQPSKGKGKKIILVAALAIGLFVGGGFAGAALADPTTSDEYKELLEMSGAIEDTRDSYRDQLSAMTSKYNTLSGGLDEREKALAGRESAVGEKETEVSEAEEAVATREKAVGSAEAEAEANTISDGTWTVGEDIKAGTYRTTSAVSSRCYWGIYRSGSNGSDIIDNDIPNGGRPTVTLSKGQDFKSSNCGDWQKK